MLRSAWLSRRPPPRRRAPPAPARSEYGLYVAYAPGVAALYVLSRMLADRVVALFLAGLMAVSYHHVFFSQNARGYTMMMFFFILSTVLFLQMPGRERVGARLTWGYALSVALGTYANPFGGFVLVGHAAVAGVLWILRRRGSGVDFPVRGFILAAAMATAAIVLTYLPFVTSMMEFTRTRVADTGGVPRLGGGVLVEVLEGMRAALGGWPGVLILGLAGLAGVWFWMRRYPVALALLTVPLVCQAAALAALGGGVHPRYFANAMPGVLLIAGTSVAELIRQAGTRVGVAGTVGVPLALALTVATSALPLREYYRYPKQDYLGAVAAVAAHARPGDARVGVHLAGHVILGYYRLPYIQVETASELQALETHYPRLWLVTTLERLLAADEPALARRIHERYQVVEVFPGTVGDGAVRLYVGPR